jgi:hypothetical protein
LLALRVLAWAHYELGEIPRARALHQEVVQRARAAGNMRMEQTSLGALSEYALYDRDVAEAVPLLEKAYRINREVGEFREIAVNLCRFALAAALSDEPHLAARLLGASEVLHERAGAQMYPWVATMNEQTLAITKEALGAEAFAAEVEQGRQLTADDAIEAALLAMKR